MRVLIVDDSATERFTVESIMKEAGWDTSLATNGEEAINMVKENKPDLVLMDIVMPGTNGYQATREIHKTESLKDIPVIICTSRGAETDKVWGMRQGADEYLVKPITKDKLLPAIEKVLNNRKKS